MSGPFSSLPWPSCTPRTERRAAKGATAHAGTWPFHVGSQGGSLSGWRGAGPMGQRGQGGSEAARVWPPEPLGLRDTGAPGALEQGRACRPGSGPVCPAAVWRTGRRAEGGSGERLAGVRRRSGPGDFPRRSRSSAPARLWVLRARGQGRLQAGSSAAQPARGPEPQGWRRELKGWPFVVVL